jgi:hypothetical protein
MAEGAVTLEVLPAKARKRRRLVPPPASPAPALPPGVRPSSVGHGIASLDVARLAGSQRIGIIGLPGTEPGFFSSKEACVRKSTCVKSLLAELCYSYPVVTVFSGSEGDNPFYGSILPKLFVHNRVSQRGLKLFVNRQRLAIGYDSPLKDALFILDARFESPQALDNSTVRILFKQGRHLRSAVWVVQQYVIIRTSFRVSHPKRGPPLT